MSASFLKILTIVSAASAAVLASQANAEESVAVGRLTCGVKGGVSFIIGSTKELRCVYKPGVSQEGVERYEGQIKKYGLDIGVTDNAMVEWVVLAPTRGLQPGALAGNYVGVAADASFAAGGGANVLVGGSNRSISLQPVSVQGQTGVNAAVAIAEVELHPVAESIK